MNMTLTFTVIFASQLKLVLQNGTRSNVNKPIESQQVTSYVLTVAIFVLSITIYEIFTAKICMTLTLTFTMAMVKCKYTNRKPISNFQCIGYSNNCSICHRLRDIRIKFCITLTLSFRMGQGQM